MYRHQNAVTPTAALAKVAVLEIERGLGEAVSVCEIMDGVNDIECVSDGSLYVGRYCRVQIVVVFCIEIEAGRCLVSNFCVAEGSYVVATADTGLGQGLIDVCVWQ